MVLNLKKRQAFVMQMNCTNNIFFFISHFFKTILFHKSKFAFVAFVKLFYSRLVISFSSFYRIHVFAFWTSHRFSPPENQRKTYYLTLTHDNLTISLLQIL